MGLPFDPKFYDDVVQACGLVQDFAQFVDGDETVVGDRGVQCSGGQRARIGLSRALYRDADVLLLDDPLSAVDSKVGRLIFYSAVQDLAVKRGKCVVLGKEELVIQSPDSLQPFPNAMATNSNSSAPIYWWCALCVHVEWRNQACRIFRRLRSCF